MPPVPPPDPDTSLFATEMARMLGEPALWSFRPEFGPYLRELRERSRLSLREASERAEGSPTVLARLETGQKVKRPPVEFIRRIADVYGRDREDLLRRAGFVALVEEIGNTAADDEAEFEALLGAPELRPPSFGDESLKYIAPVIKRQWVQFARLLAAADDPKALVERLLDEAKR